MTLRSLREMAQIHSDLYRRMTSLEFKMQLAAEQRDRIRRIVNCEQLLAATFVLPDKRGRHPRDHKARVRYWQKQARASGWPDGMAVG